jgi:hypothetical protein
MSLVARTNLLCEIRAIGNGAIINPENLRRARCTKDATGAERVSEALQLFKGSARAPVRRNSYWLITKHRHAGVDILTMGLADGRRMLPDFSFEEEAALYLRRGIRGSWGLRPTEVGELVSLLCGLCREVELVALDPMSDVEVDVVKGFVSLEREGFVDVLLRR